MSTENSPREIMTLTELANYLKVAEKTVVRMAREGKIPGTKVASQWRFMRSMVDQWLENRMQNVHTDNMFELLKMAPEVVPVSRLVAPDLMIFDIKPGSVPEVLEQLILPLEKDGMVDDPKSTSNYWWIGKTFTPPPLRLPSPFRTHGPPPTRRFAKARWWSGSAKKEPILERMTI